MQDNIRISIKNDLDSLLKKKEFSEFYLGLYNLLTLVFNNDYYANYLKILKANKKSWNVTVTTNHRKTDVSFGVTLDNSEHKRLVKLHKQGDMSKLWTAWNILNSFKKIADKPIQPWTKINVQKAWDFNQNKWDYLEIIGEKGKINDDKNTFETNFSKYKLAIKMIGEDFLNYLEKKENVFDFIGVKYDKRTCKLSFGKKIKIVANDDQRIKFFEILGRSQGSVGYRKICEFCLPEITMIRYKGCNDNYEYCDPAKNIKKNFVDLLIQMGCKKEIIDKNLKPDKNHGYIMNRK